MGFEEFRRFEYQGWTEVAGRYAESFGALTRLGAGALVDGAAIARGDHVLDVACGPGFAAAAALARGAVATGIDFSPTMIEVATREVPGARFREADAGALPFDDASFDAVVSNFGVQHFPDPDRALAEMARVLRPGGRLAFTVWDEPARSTGQRLLQEAVAEAGRTDLELPAAPAAHRFADADEVARALAAAGLTWRATTAVPLTWHAATADDVFASYHRGTVRLGSQLRGQTPEALADIRAAFARRAEAYRDAQGIALPMQAVLSTAVRGKG